ncbi:predicted protein [Arabidopsis lyrata subsp. lyrata]|uniref:Predicted protein n=1 Tax=Arabidopsis lyrata subsp. lyrata TaxID=81972 RepID=D7LQ34_ARALL|nr:predicted protein [Arabidopsis lyrata subsp. lyrata]
MDQSLKKVIEGEINIEWTIVSPRSKLEFLVQSFPLAASNQSMGESRLNHRNQVKGRFPQEAILKKETIPSEKYVVHEKKLKHLKDDLITICGIQREKHCVKHVLEQTVLMCGHCWKEKAEKLQASTKGIGISRLLSGPIAEDNGNDSQTESTDATAVARTS